MKARSRWIAAAAVAGVGACIDTPPPPAPIATLETATGTMSSRRAPEFVQTHVLVRYRSGADGNAVAARHGAKPKKKLGLERAELLEVAAGQEQAALAALLADPDVESAELDELIVVAPCELGSCDTPTDGFNATYKWDLHNTGSITNNATGLPQATGKADADIDWNEAYDALGGQAFTGSAVIGILDTGIRPTHLETAGRVIAAKNFATGYPETLTEDRDGHGTHVATIAAGRANGAGTAGVAYGANIKLINAKICERYLFPDGIVRTSCPTSSQVDAIRWAVDQGANVLNLSIGGSPLATSGSPLVQASLAYAISKNVLPVCAAGNDNYPNTAFPARFPECMAVAASNWSDARASYSNYAGDVEVSAPGGDGNPTGSASSLILAASHTADNRYTWKAGTSMATPQVVGLAALLYARGLTNVNDVRQRIISTADPLAAPGMGSGRINAYRALTLLDPNAPPVAVPAPGSIASEGSASSFSAAASFDPNGKPLSAYLWNFGDGNTSTIADPTHIFADNGSYTVTLTVTDQAGLTHSKSLSVSIANVAPSVELSLSDATVPSGASAGLIGSFSDPGVNDATWKWVIDWGNGTSSGEAALQSAIIAATNRFCEARVHTVVLSVRDKDDGVGSASKTVTVTRVPMTIALPGAINGAPNGTVPVTIFGTTTLDASQIDVATLTLGDGNGADASVNVRPNGTLHAALDDVNGDGRLDLVAHVSRDALAAAGDLSDGTAQLTARATLKDGCVRLEGTASVK